VSGQHASYRVTYSDRKVPEPGALRWTEHFNIDFDAFRRHFSGELPPRLVDLLRVGMAVFVADRHARRGQSAIGQWTRKIRVVVDLADLAFWASGEVMTALRDVTDFVTGDEWEFEFEQAATGREWNRSLFTRAYSSDSPLICLYSGGLESAAGLAISLRDRPARLALPATVLHQPGQGRLINLQFDRLREHFGATIEPLVVRTRIRHSSARRKWEPTCRGRSVLYLAVGAAAAVGVGAERIDVFESGTGAINIPLMAGMTGSKATRNCHPEFLRRMSHLASLVAGREIVFRLPFISWTKGEMAAALRRAGLAGLARDTISCARYPLGRRPYQQCGVCPACVFRRQALIAGGIDEPDGSYTLDVFGSAGAANAIPEDELWYLKAFLMQVSKLDDIETTMHLPEPVRRHLIGNAHCQARRFHQGNH
jgi:7-cyano-7-deazaguanine synthase in queuosine biosynthesis